MPKVTQISAESFLQGRASSGQKKSGKRHNDFRQGFSCQLVFMFKHLVRFSHSLWRQRKKQSLECLAVMWGSSCSPGPEGCWRKHVLVMWSYLFIGKPPTSESNSALLFIHLQTQMGLAEIAGNQSSSCAVVWAEIRALWVPSVWNSLCHYELFSLSHCFFPSPSTCYIHSTAMSHGSEKGTKRQVSGPGQLGWVCLASLSLLTCANQKEHSVSEVQIYWLSDLPRSLWFLDRNQRCESEIHWLEIPCTKLFVS